MLFQQPSNQFAYTSEREHNAPFQATQEICHHPEMTPIFYLSMTLHG
jgi:hypothetical protein